MASPTEISLPDCLPVFSPKKPYKNLKFSVESVESLHFIQYYYSAKLNYVRSCQPITKYHEGRVHSLWRGLKVYLKSRISKIYVTKLEKCIQMVQLPSSQDIPKLRYKLLKLIHSIWNGRLRNNLWCHSCTTQITIFVFLCIFKSHCTLCQNVITVSLL